MLILNKVNRAKNYLERLPYINQNADDIDFLLSSREFKTRILSLIEQAQSRIYITALYWQKDEAGKAILEALYQTKQARPDLEIKILVDWHRAQRGLIGAEDQSSNADWYLEMKAQYPELAEDAIEFWGVPINGREVFGVLHFKGFVFDDTVLYSGASINNVYLHHFERYRYDRYHQVTNSILADSIVQFIQQHILPNEAVNRLDVSNRPKTAEIRPQIRAFRKYLMQQQYQLVANAEREGLKLLPIAGLGRKNQLNKVIEALFYQVQQKLVICTPYFNFPRSLQTRIQWLLLNGRQVEIIVGDKTANDFYTPPAEKFTMASALPYLYEKNLRAFSKRFAPFIDNGQLLLRLWKDSDNSYHLKGGWVDDSYILLTGNNLNPRAWGLDAENAILIHDPKHQLSAMATAELDTIRTHTTLIKHYSELESLKDYPDDVRNLLKKFKRVKLDKIVKMIL